MGAVVLGDGVVLESPSAVERQQRERQRGQNEPRPLHFDEEFASGFTAVFDRRLAIPGLRNNESSRRPWLSS